VASLRYQRTIGRVWYTISNAKRDMLYFDAERAEKEGGYTLYYASANSPMLALLYTLFDFSKENVPKGVLEVGL